MGKVSLFLVALMATVMALSAEEAPPPMYAAHDYASGELQKRRTIKPGEACDAEFGTDLEGIVIEMERNKDANEELATKLRKQFQDLMDKNTDKNLCEKATWCDMGVCRKRGKIQGRSMDSGPSDPAAAGGAVAASKPPPPKVEAPPKAAPPPKAPPAPKAAPKKPFSEQDEDNAKMGSPTATTAKTTTTTPSAAGRESILSSTTSLLTIIAIVLPYLYL